MADDPTAYQEARVIILRRMVVCRDALCLHVCLHVFKLTEVVLTQIELSVALTLHCSLEHFPLFLFNIISSSCYDSNFTTN